MNLTDAQKGILLSDRAGPDGELRVVCSLGFEHDPQDSAIAQRFATAVIERDTTIREDEGPTLDHEKRTPADEEVQNLLAIPVYVLDDFSGVIICANREEGFEHLDDDVLLAVGDHAGAVLQNARLHGDLRNAYLSTIRVLAGAIELKDPGLRGHSDAVSEYVLAVADRLEFEPRQREALIFGSLLHDVGKLGISERILLKPGSLTDEERSVIELHPRIGYQLVRQVPALEQIAPAILHHHERFDGDGYPGHLRGETIPLEARIIAVADAFSAMTSNRPYSGARTAEEACAELERCAGTQFDPEVVRLFVEEVRRRPPDQFDTVEVRPDPELEVHMGEGEFVLGGPSFAMTDSLTLLYSLRHLHDTAHAEAQRAGLQQRPFAIVAVQLEELGEINRSRGFAPGDAVLQAVAAVMQNCASRHDGLAFRASGRRLALLLSGRDEEAAGQIACELQEQLAEAHRVSVAAVAWRPGEDGEQVIERALRAVNLPVQAGS
jgi:diguanylate cyclase (GGDEF)-like protein